MPKPQKYFAPCEIHTVYTSKCRHCAGWARLMHRKGGPQIPRAKNPGSTGKTWRKRRRWPLLTLPAGRGQAMR